MKKTFVLFAIFLSAFVTHAVGQRVDRVAEAIAKNPEKEFLVYIFEIKEVIGPPVVFKANRAFEEADSLRADFILIHLNTYGGLVESADSIRTRLLQSDIPIIVFIDNNAASAGALISLAADQIYMRPGGNIGAATPVGATGQEVSPKIKSYMSSMMRSTAETRGRNPDIAEAMVDPLISIPGLVEVGQVVTLTASEAIEWGFSEGTADNITEVLYLANIQNYQITELRLTWIDHIIAFLISPLISGLLIMLILGGIYFELQTPGIGFPLMVAFTAAIIYFAPLYIEGLATNWEIILFILGIILLGVEIFVTPGFGVAGVLGSIFAVTGLAMAMLANDGFDLSGVPLMQIVMAFMIVIIASFFALIFSFYLGRKLFTQTSHFRGFALATVESSDEGFTSASAQVRILVGRTGFAFTMLRPSGKVEIDGDVYDATAISGFIEKGKPVRVVKYETAQLFVEKM